MRNRRLGEAMSHDANRQSWKFIHGIMLVSFLCWCLCSLLAQQQEPETPPPPPLPPPQARMHERLAIRAGRMFDGKSDALEKQQIILVEGTRIVQVGPRAKYTFQRALRCSILPTRRFCPA